MAYIPASNSVVGFQSQPSSLLVGASIIGLTPVNVVNTPSPSTISYQLAGSILAVSGNFTSGNTSVTAFQGGNWITSVVSTVPSSMLVGASIMGTVPVTQTTSPWVINQPSPSIIANQAGGSILAVNMPSPSVIAYQLAGSIQAVSGSFTTGNSSVQLLGGIAVVGSIATLQGTNPWLIGNSSVLAFQGTTPWTVNSILGTYQEKNAITASAIGIPVLFKIDETNSVLSAVSPQSPFPIRGSVTALQGTNPWIVNATGSIATVGNGSVTAYQGGAWSTSVTGGYVNVIGSVALGVGNTSVTQAGAWNVNVNSILGTYVEKNATVASAIGIPFLWKNNFTTSTLSTISINDPLPVQGSVMALQGTNPWIVQAISSIAVAVNSTNTSIFTVGAGTQITSVMNTNPSSLMVGASIFGTVPVTQVTSPWVVNMPSPSVLVITPAGSVQAVRMDNASVVAVLSNSSVAVLQGTNPWIVNMPSPSVIATQLAGSVMAVSGISFTISSVTLLGGSVLGTYADNSAWAEGSIGLYELGVRNDTMSSVSAADVRFAPIAVGPIGETLVANAPITKWIQGITSVFTGTSVQAIAPQGSSIFTYITALQIANESANNVRVTFTGGLGLISSVLGYTVAPANGGSNIYFPNGLKTGQNSGFSASISAVASVYISAQGFISKT